MKKIIVIIVPIILAIVTGSILVSKYNKNKKKEIVE